MKTCPFCKATKMATAYYVRTSGQLSAYCRPCTAEYAKARYRADPESGRARLRRWAKKNPATINAWRRKWEAANPKEARVVHAANQAVYAAVVKGTLVRPDLCSQCNQPARRIEAAHTDYSHPLDITWLCTGCHRRFDKANPKTHGLVPAL